MGRRHKKNAVTAPPKKPCIIFNTVPKSGSVYITMTLQTGLTYSYMSISPGYVPHDDINVDLLNDFFNAGTYITQEHLDASILNTDLLKRYTDKIVVHFRDPRAVLLSWTHHMNNLNDHNHYYLLDYVTPTPPREYYNWNLEQQIDWQIENFLPNIVTWMNDWLEFKAKEENNASAFKVLITTYEDFHTNELEFYYKILDFYGIPRGEFKFNPPAKNANTHFRNGEIEEWRSVFTERQLQRINQIVPDELLERFNWGATLSNKTPILTVYSQDISMQQNIMDILNRDFKKIEPGLN